jgi:negative regulator of flagellin synthesis FlgM
MNTIDSISAQNLSRAYVQNTDAAQQARPDNVNQNRQAPSPQADSVSLSDGAKSLAAARDAVQNTPDVREQKVAAIKQQISDGTYSVSSQVLARRMLANQQPPQ